MSRLTTSLIFCILCCNGFSQKDTTSFEAKEIEVSDTRMDHLPFTRSARNMTIITAEDLKSLPVQTVAEAIGYFSGVDLRQRGPMGAQGDLSIMGSTFEQVLVLVDGIPMRDPQTGHNQMNLPVDISQIARIEILKGSATRIYGANALAGAINIVTKTPGTEKLYVQAFGASPVAPNDDKSTPYGTAGGRIVLGIKGKNELSGHQLTIGFIRTDGYRYNSDNTQKRVSYRGAISIGKGILKLQAGTSLNKFGANGFYAYPYDANATENVETTFGAIGYETTIGKWKIKPLFYGRYNHDDYIFIKQNPSVYRNNHFTTGAGAELHATKQNELGQFGIGYESRAEIIRSNNLGHHERYFQSVYAEQRIRWDNMAVLSFGAQAQHNTDYGLLIYPGAEFSVPVYRHLHSFGNVGLGSRLPTYTDLYYSDRSNQGNKNLTPEWAFNAEGGLKWDTEFLRFSASYCYRRTTDFIDFVRASDTLKWTPQNFQSVDLQGVDANAQYYFHEGKARIQPLMIRAGFTLLQGNIQQKELSSKYQLDHLSQQFTSQFSIRTFGKITHTFSLRYLERFNGKSHAIADYRLRVDISKWSITADVNNVFDRVYIESGYIPQPGRWFRLGVEFKL